MLRGDAVKRKKVAREAGVGYGPEDEWFGATSRYLYHPLMSAWGCVVSISGGYYGEGEGIHGIQEYADT